MGSLVCSAPCSYSVSEVNTLIIDSRIVAHHADLVTEFEREGESGDRSRKGKLYSF